MSLSPDDISLWIVNFQRQEPLYKTINGWLNSFPFEEINIIANDPGGIHRLKLEVDFPMVKVWPNIFRDAQECGSIAWCWNQCMRHTFESKQWCLMSQDDVDVRQGWDELIGDYNTYIAPAGDVVQLQSTAGFADMGWFDERFRAIGGPEADYLLRGMQACPDMMSVHDEHCWQLRHNDVGLADYWRAQPRQGEIAATRAKHNESFADVECFQRWMQKWGQHVDPMMTTLTRTGNWDLADRMPGWEEIDWYPSFTRRMRHLGLI